jgi:hypothetical protein
VPPAQPVQCYVRRAAGVFRIVAADCSLRNPRGKTSGGVGLGVMAAKDHAKQTITHKVLLYRRLFYNHQYSSSCSVATCSTTTSTVHSVVSPPVLQPPVQLILFGRRLFYNQQYSSFCSSSQNIPIILHSNCLSK